VIAGQHVLTGAQPPEVWGQVIEEIVAQLAART
ncbi:MAG: DsbA family oxidoreductase, partial [Rhodobacteraceae bacterium]|nr:DsbA family oxidoreductase [Paracoccaceae bacterium]